MGDILGGFLKFSNIFLGCLKFLIFLGAKGRCWARVHVCRKIGSTPPPPPPGAHLQGPKSVKTCMAFTGVSHSC